MLNNLCTPAENIQFPTPTRGCTCSEISLHRHKDFTRPSAKFAQYLIAFRYQPYVPFVVELSVHLQILSLIKFSSHLYMA